MTDGQTAELVARANSVGLELQHRNGRLVVRGPARTDPNFVQSLLAAKHAILAHLLQPTADEWELWTERAAIAEYDGEQSRADAETLAWCELQRRRDELGKYFENSAAILGGERST